MEERLLGAAVSGDLAVLQSCISRGNLFAAAEAAGGSTVAHLSAQFGHAQFLGVAVLKHPPLLAKANSNGDTPFHCAARFGNVSCVNTLIQIRGIALGGGGESQLVGVRPDSLVDILKAGNKSGNTPLHEAIGGRHEEIAKLLFEADPDSANIANNAGESPLYLASNMTQIRTVELLFGDGKQRKNIDGPGGKTALHAAVCRDQDGLEVARLLLNYRSLNLNIERDDSGSTPMHYVASKGDLRMAKLLLDDYDAVAISSDNNGLSPLHVAAIMGHIPIIDEILRHRPHGAELRDNKGRTFLHLAVEHKVKAVIRFVLKTSTLESLLNMEDNMGNTPIKVAVNGGNQEILNMLLAMDKSLLHAAMSGNTSVLPGIRDDHLDTLAAGGNTVAHLSAKFGHLEFLKDVGFRRCSLLVKVNSDGDTPFHCAARFGNVSCVDSLIRIRKDILQEGRRYFLIQPPQLAGLGRDSLVDVLKMRNKRGNSPLHEAIRGRHEDIVELLFDADPDSAKIANTAGESPLYLASNMTLIRTVKLLLGDGTEGQPNFHGPHGKTALHAAVCRDQDGLEVAQLLLNHRGLDLNIKGDDSGNTPMHYVASTGDLSMAKLLLEDYDSVVVSSDNNGLSPLHVAATMGHIPIIEEIRRRRPDVADLRDNKGRTFLHLAVDHKVKEVIRYVLKTRELEWLLNLQDGEGNTPIHVAVNGGNLEILRMFLGNEKVDTSITNDSGMTPLDRVSSIAKTSLQLRKYKMMQDLLLAGSKHNPQRFDLTVKKRRRTEEEEVQRCRDIIQNLTITSVLIATVTFAAAFTLPGGYREDNGSSNNLQTAAVGTALLARKIAFKIFLLSDAVAMASSVIIALILIRTGTWDHDIRSFTIRSSLVLMWFAVGGMVVAFATGAYLTVASDSMWLAVAIIIISCSVPIVIYLLNRFPSWHIVAFRNQIRILLSHFRTSNSQGTTQSSPLEKKIPSTIMVIQTPPSSKSF